MSISSQNFKDRLININPNADCLKFLADRVLSKNYRGMHLVQHTRYTYEQLIGHIKGLYDHFGTDLVHLRTTDLKKRPENTPEEYPYRDYTAEMRTLYGQSTQDTLRKNNFVDYHRMGIIYRYKKDKTAVDGFYRGQKRYASISPLGESLISQNRLIDEKSIYLRCLSNLLANIPNIMRDISIDQNKKFFTKEEYMFFISYIGAATDIDPHYIYTKNDIADFLIEWNDLPKHTRITVTNLVKEYCNPGNFSGNKISKRDFHNWSNNVQSIFMHLGRTVYFESDEPFENLYSREMKSAQGKIKLNRSLNAKHTYFKKHNVEREKGFELHHVYPLFFHKNQEEWDFIDQWDNLIYIDGYSHAKITQMRDDCPVELNFQSNGDINIKHSTDQNKNVLCKFTKNILYNPSLKDTLLKKNRELLKIK